MKPRWKIIVELAVSVAIFLIGGSYMVTAVDAFPDITSVVYGALGMLLIWWSGPSIEKHWNEL